MLLFVCLFVLLFVFVLFLCLYVSQSWHVSCHLGGLVKALKTLTGEGRVRPELTIWELPGFPSGSLSCAVSHPCCD